MSSRPTILVVDDDPAILKMFDEVFTLEGYTIETAVNGLEAVQLVEQSPSVQRIMLLDINMPIMDGFAVIRWFTEHAENRAHTKIIAISAYPLLEQVTDDQVDAKISKPLGVDTLLAMFAKFR